MKNSNDIDELLVKYLTGSATKEERDTSLEWIRKDPNNRKHFEELKAYFKLAKLVQSPSGYNSEESWERVKSKYYKDRYTTELNSSKRFRKRLLIRVAAAAAAVIILTFAITGAFNQFRFGYRSSSEVFNIVEVPLGAKTFLTLADGTKVWLNAGSKFRYPVNFDAGVRHVFLEGEAFFDVIHSDEQSFIVQTGEIRIKVYGTQFNVKSYPDENIIQTTLVQGSVVIESLFDENGADRVYLKPNQTATFYKNSKQISTGTQHSIQSPGNSDQIEEQIEVVPKSNLLPIISWKDEKWVIDAEILGDLAIKLERRYDVSISFENEILKTYKFSGTLSNETFEQVLKIIQLSAPVVFSIDGNKVIFHEDPLYRKKYDEMITK